jgi:hypothetical protein
MARSGTTFLANLLNDHFDYGMGPEASFIPEFARRLRRFGNLDRDRNLHGLIHRVCKTEMLEIARRDYAPDERFDVTPELVSSKLSGRTYSHVVRAVLESVAELQKKTRAGCKYPMFWRYPNLIENLFGQDALYLWIVRDGRDAALSLMEQPWGQKSAYACALHWKQSMESLCRFRTSVPESRLHVIRYEDLVSNPESTLARVNTFVEGTLTDEQISAIGEQICSSSLSRNYDKWKRAMSRDEIRRFEAVGAPWLRDMGYQLTYSDPTASWFERARYSAEEFARRAMRALA